MNLLSRDSGANYKTRAIALEMATDLFPVSDLSPQFLNASWADIVEAEELEDFEAIERLRYYIVAVYEFVLISY